LLVAGGSAQAEEITEKNLNVRLPEGFSRGQARVQIRTGFDYTPGEAAGSEFGVLVQPRLDARSETYGHVFAVATTTGGVNAASADPMLEDQGLTGLKQLYGGWSSGSLLDGLGEDALTISIGHETIEDGDGVLSWFSGADACDTGCWLRRQATGFRSFSASLTSGAIQQRVFYASTDSEDSSSFAGIRTTVTGSVLEVGAGFVASIEEDTLAVTDDPVLGRLSASYKLRDILPWSPVLSSGYGFAFRMQDSIEFTDAEISPVYPWGERTVDLGLSIQPVDTMTLKAGYSSALSESWLHGVDASAEWRPVGGLALRLEGRLSEADPRSETDEAEREAALNGSVDLRF
jgi:hypothetical protein